MPEVPELLTPAEAAAFLRISMTTIRKMLRERRLPYSKIGRRVLINRADLDALLDASRVVAVTGRPVPGLPVTETADTTQVSS